MWCHIVSLQERAYCGVNEEVSTLRFTANFVVLGYIFGESSSYRSVCDAPIFQHTD